MKCIDKLEAKESYRLNYSDLLEYISTLQPSGNFLGIEYYDIKCHTDPAIFMSPIIASISQLTFQFNLSYVEVVSILRTFASMPHTTHYFAITAILYMKQNKLPIRGELLGRELLKHMKVLYDNRSTKIPGLRFNKYNEIEIPSVDTWIYQVQTFMFFSLVAFQMEHFVIANKKKKQTYINLYWQDGQGA